MHAMDLHIYILLQHTFIKDTNFALLSQTVHTPCIEGRVYFMENGGLF